jgi:CRP-like cAMP-binding protein
MDLVGSLVTALDKHSIWESELILARNDYLKTGGTIDTNVYFIEEGSMRVFLMDTTEEHTIRFGYTGNLIASLDSFITNQASDLYIQALKKTKLKVISKSSFLEFVATEESITELWHQITYSIILQHMERERDLLISSPKERYLRVLKRSPQLFQYVPHKYIASYLKMSPETLSRLKKS